MTYVSCDTECDDQLQCDHCEDIKVNTDESWFYLSRYHGISGIFCPSCYNMVRHDAHGKPGDPAGYTMIRLKMSHNGV